MSGEVKQMGRDQVLVSSIYEGWHAYQQVLIRTLEPLSPGQIELGATSELGSVRELCSVSIITGWKLDECGEALKAKLEEPS
jgi:hypothetical protein